MRLKRSVLVLLVLLAAASAGRAQDVPMAALPDSTVKPTFVGLTVIDIPEINAREETFRLEGVLVLEWQDPRYAGGPLQSYIGEAALDKLEREVWWVYPEFENARGDRQRRGIELAIYPDGVIYYEERFSTLLSFRPDLRRFPFDTQELYVSIFPSLADTSFVQFLEESHVAVSPEYRPVEWEVKDARFEIGTGAVYGLEPELGYYTFSHADFFIRIQRRPGFYLWKILVPILLFTTISWVSFWMTTTRTDLGRRVAVLVTTLLTAVAYSFATGEFLPRIPYLTFLDVVVLVTYFTIGLAILETVVVFVLADTRGVEAGLRLDRLSRVAFPVAYALVLGVAAVAYL